MTPLYDAVMCDHLAAKFFDLGVSGADIPDSAVGAACTAPGSESDPIAYAFGQIWDAVRGLTFAAEVECGVVLPGALPDWDRLPEDDRNLFVALANDHERRIRVLAWEIAGGAA